MRSPPLHPAMLLTFRSNEGLPLSGVATLALLKAVAWFYYKRPTLRYTTPWHTTVLRGHHLRRMVVPLVKEKMLLKSCCEFRTPRPTWVWWAEGRRGVPIRCLTWFQHLTRGLRLYEMPLVPAQCPWPLWAKISWGRGAFCFLTFYFNYYLEACYCMLASILSPLSVCFVCIYIYRGLYTVNGWL